MTVLFADDQNTTIIVLGASGDLAFKKTYPALYGLFYYDMLPKSFQIVGYARSEITITDFKQRVSSKIKGDLSKLTEFLDACFYVSGKYDEDSSFQKLNGVITRLEESSNTRIKNRVFYMALPPSVFIPASNGLKKNCYISNPHTNRIVVEKPFGKDLDSSRELSSALASCWSEDEIYRIDHYLGKEMVKNLMTLRFSNMIVGSIWNKSSIHNVQITFKEPIGTEGRGGYFDEFGIIRDIMQNHLFQILSIVAMNRPKSLSSNDVRDEKVKVLQSIKPLTIDDILLGQYTASLDGKTPGYLQDPTVPKDSVTPTFAAAVFNIDNDEWRGVPFILKCGKALNEQKAEIRIQFHNVAGSLYPNAARNELVIRVQPNEAVYMKFNNKEPGLSNKAVVSELELTYKDRYASNRIPDAYENLIFDVLVGEKSNFVRDDELDAAWKIFTPVLDKIEKERAVKIHEYSFGTRGPIVLDEFIEKAGYTRSLDYKYRL